MTRLRVARDDQALDRLNPSNSSGLAFQKLWQKNCESVETAFDDIQSQLTQIIAAQATATSAARESARISSYPNPGSILSASDAGSNATITIAAHVRVYPVQGLIDVPDVTFTNLPHNITGLAYSTLYFVYYDDTTLANTAPTFLTTTSAVTAQVGTAAGGISLDTSTRPRMAEREPLELAAELPVAEAALPTAAGI
jgi:hypothetical protein